MSQTAGWGAMPWGAGPWGASSTVALQLLNAQAQAENVIRLTFNVAPQFDQLLGPNDASNPARYSVTPVAGTSGRDGLPTRPVAPIAVAVADVALSFGSVIDVTVDRPFSPWPSGYIVACNQLVVAETFLFLDPSKSSRAFQGVYRELRVQSTETALPSRDIANPQTYSAQLDPLPQAGDPAILGIFALDSTGDYAFDKGLTNLKKRVLRRLLTPKGSIAALPGYGVGVGSFGKRLALTGIRQQICADAQAQIGQEPDVDGVSVTAASAPSSPSLVTFTIKVRSRSLGPQTFTQTFAST